MVVVAQSALRCVELLKPIGKLRCIVGKLFAKHMTPAQQHKFLEQRRMAIVVGTPNRLLRLLDDEALKLFKCNTLIIDMKPSVKSFTVSGAMTHASCVTPVWCGCDGHFVGQCDSALRPVRCVDFSVDVLCFFVLSADRLWRQRTCNRTWRPCTMHTSTNVY